LKLAWAANLHQQKDAAILPTRSVWIVPGTANGTLLAFVLPYENFPQARSDDHQMSPAPAIIIAPKPIHPMMPTAANPAPTKITGTIEAI